MTSVSTEALKYLYVGLLSLWGFSSLALSWQVSKSGNFCTSSAVFVIHFPGGLEPTQSTHSANISAQRKTWQRGKPGKVTFHAEKEECMWHIACWYVSVCAQRWGREFSVGTGRQLCREFKQLTEDETLAAERTSGVTRHIKKATSV